MYDRKYVPRTLKGGLKEMPMVTCAIAEKKWFGTE